MHLRVATYNVRKCIGLDWRRRPERILSVVDDLGADVIALQEADRRFGRRFTTLSHLSLTDAGYRPVAAAAHDGGIGWHGNAILIQPRLEVEAVHRVTLPALEPRGAVIADLRGEGRALRVVATHLGLTRGMRVRQAGAILAELDRLEPRPTVVMGDMNTWHPSAGCIAVFSKRFGFAPPAPTYHASRPVAPLDRIAVSKGVEVVDRGVAREGWAGIASDHLPLWADLRLSGCA